MYCARIQNAGCLWLQCCCMALFNRWTDSCVGADVGSDVDVNKIIFIDVVVVSSVVLPFKSNIFCGFNLKNVRNNARDKYNWEAVFASDLGSNKKSDKFIISPSSCHFCKSRLVCTFDPVGGSISRNVPIKASTYVFVANCERSTSLALFMCSIWDRINSRGGPCVYNAIKCS